MSQISVTDIARIVHEANSAYCITQGDYSQPSWDAAPEWQKESARNGVVFRLMNPDTSPEDMHENWWREKREAGWVFGLAKDPEKKTHPCCVPYDQLPEFQRKKDELFSAIVDLFRNKTLMEQVDAEQELVNLVNDRMQGNGFPLDAVKSNMIY